MTKKSDEDSIHPSETAYDKAIKRMEEREAHIFNTPAMQIAADAAEQIRIQQAPLIQALQPLQDALQPYHNLIDQNSLGLVAASLSSVAQTIVPDNAVGSMTESLNVVATAIQPYQQDMNLFNSNVLAAFEAAAITPELRDFRTQFEVNVQEMGDGMSAISDYVNGLTSQWDNALGVANVLERSIAAQNLAMVRMLPCYSDLELPRGSKKVLRSLTKTTAKKLMQSDEIQFDPKEKDFYHKDSPESKLSADQITVVESSLELFAEFTLDELLSFESKLEQNFAFAVRHPVGIRIYEILQNWKNFVSFENITYYHARTLGENQRPFHDSEMMKAPTNVSAHGRYNEVGRSCYYIDCAKSKQKDFIFVTNDVKIDWYEEDKRTPRFELLKEFREQANKRIWLLSMKNFIYHVNLLLDDQIHENVLQDIDSVQDEKENDKIRKELSADDIQKIFNNLIVKPIYVIDKIPKNESIRLFDNPDIYEAEDENGRKFRIITTIVGGGNYARVLHGMTNAFELKKLYETGNEHYWYYNFIIAKNEALVEKIMEHMGKTKVRKLFADHSIQTAVCYLNEDQNINIAKANFDI